MNRHHFKLIWKKRSKNSLLILEILISFLVLFAIFTLVIYNYSNYFQHLGYDYTDTWVINMNWRNTPNDVAQEKLKHIEKHLRSQKQVEDLTFTIASYPFSFSSISTVENNVNLGYVSCDEHFFNVLRMPVTEGKSFTLDDRMAKLKPVMLNRKAAQELFNGENPVGKVFGDDSNMVVTGVVEKYRYSSSFAEDEPVMFSLLSISDSTMMRMDNILVRVKPGTTRTFEAQLVDELSQIVPGWDVEIQWLKDLKKTKNSMSIGLIWILIIIAVFLIINVILGLFGLLWYNINLRKAEIGLRRALGASKKVITRYFIKETLVLTTFAVAVGLLFAIQFPIMGVFSIKPVVYLGAIGCSLLFLYGLVFICALAPSRLASEVEPSVALYEE
ncbi:ABC transporter permease [Bacteroidota bacterium]